MSLVYEGTIVIDNGTDSFKIGNGGDEAPWFEINNIIGFSRSP